MEAIGQVCREVITRRFNWRPLNTTDTDIFEKLKNVSNVFFSDCFRLLIYFLFRWPCRSLMSCIIVKCQDK